MNLIMYGVDYRNMELKRADTLDADWPFTEKDGTQIPLKFDAVVAIMCSLVEYCIHSFSYRTYHLENIC